MNTAFVVIHRRREYGPFDYEWSPDLHSVDLTYRGTRYGEVCSPAQMYVDLREFRLPQRVVQVAMLVTGGILQSLRNGSSVAERNARICRILSAAGCRRFVEGLQVADL
ncbi:MAG: hypothetical protein KDA75_11875 [Planctomycetaceae bacterium]|nr:hypothetical protein [Planctomycetaceae bacterium]